ncbi:protein CURLY FLAG LEAF 1-like [Phaseolus vulgaris]
MDSETNSSLGSKSEKSRTMITYDFFGGSSSSSLQPQELDLDFHVPSGWKRHLDLKSGKVYIERCNSSVPEHKSQMNQVDPKLQDLNSPPPSTKVSFNPFNGTSLDLKLASHSLPSSNYQSVCTIDKVKSALERVEKKETKKRASPLNSSYFYSPSVSYSSSSSSVRDTQEEEHEHEEKLSSPLAAGCPGCLSYVIIMKHNPKCPMCNHVIPFPLKKKLKIDLNTP